MLSLKNFKRNPNIFYWSIISISVFLGTLIRFDDLGKWTLALDEYYIIKSSEFILEYGLPQFPSGGYYSRGILFQYLIALLLNFGVKAELAGRLFSVVANLLTIPPLYLISKKISNKLLAAIVIVIFSFSIWEIEFARFARMYTPFQAIFMWYMYFALEDFNNKNFKNFKWMILLSAISFLVYEGSIFLAVFNFAPFVVNKKFKLSYFIASTLTFFASTFFNMFGFRKFNSVPTLPPELVDFVSEATKQSPIKIPQTLFPFAFDNILTSILTLFLITINIYIFIQLVKLLSEKKFWQIFSLSILTIFTTLNLFGLFILSFILLVFWDLLEFNLKNKKFNTLLISLFATNLFYWFTFGILSKNWFVLFDNFSSYSIGGISKRLFVAFFNFPDNYYTILNYLGTIPIVTIFSVIFGVVLIIQLFTKLKNQKDVKFLFGSLIFVSLLATVPTLEYDETRYTFFAVPLLIILVLFSVQKISEITFSRKPILATLIFPIVVFSAFGLSKDFEFYHLINIDKADVNYRLIYNGRIKKHLYRRWDVENPVNYITKNAKKDDIIMINENSLEYYLPRVEYFNVDYNHEAFSILSIENGTKERWSEAKLIYKNDDLINFIENRKQTIWFVVFPENWLSQINFYEKYKSNLVYQGIDGLLKVYKFPKN
ncbi:MAG: glycosyltransferase family 39 protein [Ignavibacteriae bacterium]|nr:glycosyltransferase family 39 protein [Ignavibacteriota bacterium]